MAPVTGLTARRSYALTNWWLASWDPMARRLEPQRLRQVDGRNTDHHVLKGYRMLHINYYHHYHHQIFYANDNHYIWDYSQSPI